MPAVDQTTVLVVDDQTSDRGYIRYLLHQLGLRNIREAATGRAAVQYLQSEEIDLVIADWNMPEVDGLTLFKLMRKFPPTRSTPFILASNQNDHDKVRLAIQAGIDNYIIKPVTSENLRRVIESVLGVIR